MKTLKSLIIAAIVLILSLQMTVADEPLVTLASGRTLTAENALTFTENELTGAHIQEIPPEYYIIYIGKPITKELRERLLQTSYIEGYLYPYAFIIKAIPSTILELKNEGIVQFAWLYNSEYIIEKYLLAKESSQPATIALFDSADRQSILQKLGEVQVDIVDIKDLQSNTLQVIAAPTQLKEIAKISGIEWIEQPDEFEIVNDNTTDTLNVDLVRKKFGLYGEGQIVAIADTGLDIGAINSSMHHDYWNLDNNGQFVSRVLNLTDFVPPSTGLSHSSNDVQGHGTHVTGTFLGSGFLSGSDPTANNYTGSFAGMAPKAQVIFGAFGFDDWKSLSLFVSGSGNISYFYGYFYPQNPKIMSNSWGCIPTSCPNSPYKLSSQSTDAYINAHKDFVVVYAAGNFAANNTVKPPGNAKNTISVGAANGSVVASFSSRGPTDDGRIKPDLIAPGTSLTSTRSQVGKGTCSSADPRNGNYSICTGTSMATPALAGLATLVREYYQKKANHNTPSAALIKATLINGAKKKSYKWMDPESGWGFADIANALPHKRIGLYFVDDPTIQLNTGENYTTKFNRVNTSEPVTVTLVWTDYSGQVGASRELVSDLDLVVTGSDGSVYNGNDFEGNRSDQVDSINNVEKVRIANPKAANYTIKVKATNTPMGSQDFALVYSYRIDTTGLNKKCMNPPC